MWNIKNIQDIIIQDRDIIILTSILGSREQLYNIAILGRVFAQILSAVITEMFSLLNTTNLPLTSKPFTINSLAGGGAK